MKQLKISIIFLAVMSLFLGILYPLMMTLAAQIAFPGKANGSLVVADGRIVGSVLIGQGFSGPEYFHGRPSACDYDGLSSGGSNFGPTNKKHIDRAVERAAVVRKENSLPADAGIPADLVLASASGLDPHISLQAALLQAPRVARVRGVDTPVITGLVEKRAEKRYFGLFGDSFVNVLGLNLLLDAMSAGR
ncbi:MAG: potassium-transporting ATPase subunit KdpC [Spirochaetota bacterium]